MSKHSVIILGLRVGTTCLSWAWTNRTSPSNGVRLDSPLAACSVYGDLTCSVHTVNNVCLFNYQWHAYLCNWGPYVRLAYMPNMLSSWNKVIIIIIIENQCKMPWRNLSKQIDGHQTSAINHFGKLVLLFLWHRNIFLFAILTKLAL